MKVDDSSHLVSGFASSSCGSPGFGDSTLIELTSGPFASISLCQPQNFISRKSSGRVGCSSMSSRADNYNAYHKLAVAVAEVLGSAIYGMR